MKFYRKNEKMKKHFRHRFMYYGLIIYVLAASIWWSFLLLDQDKQLTDAKIDKMRMEQVEFGNITEPEFQASSEYQVLMSEAEKHKKMIYGEGSVFFIVLIIGMWILIRV